MPEKIEQLERKIAEGLEAVRELKRLTAEEQRKDRPKLRLVRGGLLGAGILAGVEWLRDYKKVAVALVATGITITGATIAEHPGSPGADPPRQVIVQPPKAKPSRPPIPRPTATPTPRRTSPPTTRAPMRITPPPAKPPVPKPAVGKDPVQMPTPSPRQATPSPGIPNLPVSTPTVSLPVTPTAIPTPEIASPDTCTINLLGVHVCLPLG